jgi:hypothetical protein
MKTEIKFSQVKIGQQFTLSNQTSDKFTKTEAYAARIHGHDGLMPIGVDTPVFVEVDMKQKKVKELESDERFVVLVDQQRRLVVAGRSQHPHLVSGNNSYIVADATTRKYVGWLMGDDIVFTPALTVRDLTAGQKFRTKQGDVWIKICGSTYCNAVKPSFTEAAMLVNDVEVTLV